MRRDGHKAAGGDGEGSRVVSRRMLANEGGQGD